MDNEANDRFTFLRDLLKSLPPAPSKGCIFKVPDHLRRVSEKAYEPEVVAIGPYHRGKPNLRSMEKQKPWYLKFLLDGYGKSLDDIIKGVETVEAEARECYAEPIGENDPGKFAGMMALDGCFIIAVLLKSNFKDIERALDDLIFGSLWTEDLQLRDLLLFENQLPLCVLYSLSDTLFGGIESRKHFIELVFRAYKSILWGFSDVFSEHGIQSGIISNCEIKHLLGLVHHGYFLSHFFGSYENSALLPQRPNKSKLFLQKNFFLLSCFDRLGLKRVGRQDGVTQDDEDMERQQDQTSSSSRNQRLKRVGRFSSSRCGITRFLLPWGKKLVHDRDSPHVEDEIFIRRAKDLQEAGIKFEKAEGCRIRDIHFQNGVLKIPSLQIHIHTDSCFRNLIAYEQFGMPERVVAAHLSSAVVSAKFVGDYVTFMDYLIDSEIDVELLERGGVIINCLGDDKVVSNLFNRLGDSIVVTLRKGNYANISRELRRHCGKRWNYHLANLRHNYFNTPWALMSFLAALLLLFLTLTQTVFAILSFAINRS